MFHLKEEFRIILNVVLISLVFMVHFTAMQGTVNLQSSINSKNGLGTASLATLNTFLVISSLFLPVLLIRWLGCKWTMACCLLLGMPYIAVHFYVDWYTLIPGAAMQGLGGSSLWVASSTYIRVVAGKYSNYSGIHTDIIISRFFGIFYMVFQLAEVWGNLISSTVFSTQPVHSDYTGYLYWCGINYLPTDATKPHVQKPSTDRIFLLVGIYLGCMVCGLLLLSFGVDSLVKYGEGKRESSSSGLSGIRLLIITIKMLKNPHMILMIPLTIFMGATQAFIAADYTSAYVACGWGISHIGYVMVCYGLCNAVFAMSSGWIVKLTGRVPVAAVASVVNICLLISLLIWKPHSNDRIPYFIIAGLWGICDAFWVVLVHTMYGILFPNKEEASYSNLRIWLAIGYIMTYAYSAYLILYIKLYILIAFYICGVIGYFIIEIQRKISIKKYEQSKGSVNDVTE